MSDLIRALDSSESFAAYSARVRELLKESVIERISFLESANLQLNSLQALARKAANVKLFQELETLAQQAQREAAALRGGVVPAPSGPTAVVAAPVAAPAIGDTLHAAPAAPAVHAALAVSNNGETHTEQPRSFGKTPYVRPAPPPVPKTPQRPLEEIYRDTERLTEVAELDVEHYKKTPGLLRMKGLLCRQRALQAELAARDIQHWPLKQLLNYIRRRIDDDHGPGHYLIPLRAEIWPAEAWPWYRLADLYDGLAEAHESLDWYDDEADKLTQPERQEVLESIAAHQTRLWRHLQAYFPRQNDETQIQFFRELCSIAEEEDIYLFSLQERCPDEELERKAEDLPVVLEHLRLDRKNRAKREATLSELKSLVNGQNFGTEDSHALDLEKAVLACREEGLPASSTALRSILLDWMSLLEQTQEKPVQEVLRELQLEVLRRSQRAEANTAQQPEPSLNEDELAELRAVRDVVRGKRCLFIGGICREEQRKKLEVELELAELVWPSTNGTESVYKFESDIQNTDVTVILIRFMRTGWGQARELAVKNNKLFVRLPAGYGLHQVTRQFFRQIVPVETREAIAADITAKAAAAAAERQAIEPEPVLAGTVADYSEAVVADLTTVETVVEGPAEPEVIELTEETATPTETSEAAPAIEEAVAVVETVTKPKRTTKAKEAAAAS
jgi:hypothetical protein